MLVILWGNETTELSDSCFLYVNIVSGFFFFFFCSSITVNLIFHPSLRNTFHIFALGNAYHLYLTFFLTFSGPNCWSLNRIKQSTAKKIDSCIPSLDRARPACPPPFSSVALYLPHRHESGIWLLTLPSTIKPIRVFPKVLSHSFKSRGFKRRKHLRPTVLYFSTVLRRQIFLNVSFCGWIMMGMQDELECIFVEYMYVYMLVWRLP